MRPVDKANPLPRFAQIKEMLRSLILAQELRPGDQLPGERELARRFEVSQMTVNRALLELESEGLLRREVGRGTFVRHPRDRALHSHKVCLLFPYPVNLELNDYQGALVQGIRSEASAAYCQFSLVEVADQDIAAVYGAVGAAGLIFFNPCDEHKEALVRLCAQRMPLVVLGASWPDAEIPCVDSDNIGGAREATEHLIALGHRRLAIINGDLAVPNSRDRFLGYQQVLQAHHLPLREEWVISAEDASLNPTSAQWVRRMLEGSDRPTAIFATGYSLAAQTIQVAKSVGLRVPEDVSVVGFDNPISAAYLDPPLTTVEQPLFEMGRRALAGLMGMMEGQSPVPCREMLPAQLVVRASTAPPASS